MSAFFPRHRTAGAASAIALDQHGHRHSSHQTLAFEVKERGLMERAPRDPRETVLTFPLLMRTALVSLLILAGAFGMFLWERARGASLAEARNVVVNVIVFVEVLYLINCRSLIHSARSLGFFSNRWMLVCIAAMVAAQLAFTYLPL